MVLFHAPLPTLLLLAATAVTALALCLKQRTPLPYLGGLLWAAGSVALLVEGGSLKEVLVIVLVLLILTSLERRRDDTP